MSRIRKTEHAGAKNGGGYWGTREEAKALSKKLRREIDKKVVRKELSLKSKDKAAMNTYAIILDKVPGKDASKETIACHIDHLRNLNKKGRLVLSGPFTDHPSGMIIVKATDKVEATKIAEADPFVKEGVRTYSLRTWLLANEENNYLG